MSKAVMNDILEANYHNGGLKILKLYKGHESFVEKLVSECLEIKSTKPYSDVTNPKHSTNWTNPKGIVRQWSLFNSSGRTDDTTQDFSRSGNPKFHFPKECAAIDYLINMLKDSNLIGIRLNYISFKSMLSAHEEHNVHRIGDKAYVRVRFHLPLITNDKCSVMLDGEYFEMEKGNIYFFNNGCIHAAQNNGSEGRYHLVWDMAFSLKCYGLMFNNELVLSNKFSSVSDSVVPKIKTVVVDRYERYGEEIGYKEAKEKLDYFE